MNKETEMKQVKRTRTIGRRTQGQRRGKRRSYRPFPYQRVAKMWKEDLTIAQIARAINRVDKNNPGDPYHSLRNFLYRMHKGYDNGRGRIVKLPHRVSKSTLRAARRAGLRAW
jgi:hypothetical protein